MPQMERNADSSKHSWTQISNSRLSLLRESRSIPLRIPSFPSLKQAFEASMAEISVDSEVFALLFLVFEQTNAEIRNYNIEIEDNGNLCLADSGIPGDGRCLFRSVVHGVCLRSGNPTPSENRQRELADELRSKVADEFIRRRADTEWFLEDDFESYVLQMRRPESWGGEPELLMSSHVLKMPITVYIRDGDCGSLKTIAEYGQEYGKVNPIRVLYNGYGHYDALHSKQSKLFKERW